MSNNNNNNDEKNAEILAAFKRLSSRKNRPEPANAGDEPANQVQVAKPRDYSVVPVTRSDDNEVPGTLIRGHNIQFQQQNYYSDAQQARIRDHDLKQSAPGPPRAHPEIQSTSRSRSRSRSRFFNVQTVWRMGRLLLYLFFIFLALVICAMVHVIFGDVLGPTYNRAVNVVAASMAATVGVMYRAAFEYPIMTGHLMKPSSCARQQAMVVLPAAEDFMMPPLEDLDVFIASSLATVRERGLISTSYEDQRVRTIQAAKSVGPRVSSLVVEFQSATQLTIESVTRFQASLASLDIEPTIPQQVWEFVVWLKESVNGARTPDLASQLRAGLVHLLKKRCDALSTAIFEGSGGDSGRGSDDLDNGVGILQVRTGVCSISEESERQMVFWQRVGDCDKAKDGDCGAEQRSRVLAQLKASCAAMVHVDSRHQRLLNLAFKERSFLIRTVGKLETATKEDVRSVLEVAASGYLDLLGEYYNAGKR